MMITKVIIQYLLMMMMTILVMMMMIVMMMTICIFRSRDDRHEQNNNKPDDLSLHKSDRDHERDLRRASTTDKESGTLPHFFSHSGDLWPFCLTP